MSKKTESKLVTESEKECENCRHWVAITSDMETNADGYQGECRAEPPKIIAQLSLGYQKELNEQVDDDQDDFAEMDDCIVNRGRFPRTDKYGMSCGVWADRWARELGVERHEPKSERYAIYFATELEQAREEIGSAKKNLAKAMDKINDLGRKKYALVCDVAALKKIIQSGDEEIRKEASIVLDGRGKENYDNAIASELEAFENTHGELPDYERVELLNAPKLLRATHGNAFVCRACGSTFCLEEVKATLKPPHYLFCSSCWDSVEPNPWTYGDTAPICGTREVDYSGDTDTDDPPRKPGACHHCGNMPPKHHKACPDYTNPTKPDLGLDVQTIPEAGPTVCARCEQVHEPGKCPLDPKQEEEPKAESSGSVDDLPSLTEREKSKVKTLAETYCYDCEKPFGSAGIMHIEIHKGVKYYRCMECKPDPKRHAFPKNLG